MKFLRNFFFPELHKKKRMKPYGWVLLGGKKWYRVYIDNYTSPMYFIRNGEKVIVTKHYPFYMKKSEHKNK
jgi:hypothetical protein